MSGRWGKFIITFLPHTLNLHKMRVYLFANQRDVSLMAWILRLVENVFLFY